VGEREALSAAEAARRGARGGGCVRLVRGEARGHVTGASPQARMRAGGGHQPRGRAMKPYFAKCVYASYFVVYPMIYSNIRASTWRRPRMRRSRFATSTAHAMRC
jgi:hypothetical protein